MIWWQGCPHHVINRNNVNRRYCGQRLFPKLSGTNQIQCETELSKQIDREKTRTT
jgi:hypothetical protein